MAIDLLQANDEVLNKLAKDNYEAAKQFIIEEGAENEYFITNESSFKLIDDDIYLISIWQGELWEEPQIIYDEKINHHDLFFISVLNKERGMI